MSELVELPVTEIVVGDRVRKHAGDITALAESIRTIGVMHPPVVTSDNRLVAGFRRLTACKSLGMETVKVYRVATLDDAVAKLTAERDENICRLDPTPEEAVAIADRLLEIIGPDVQTRRREAIRQSLLNRWAKKRGEVDPGKFPGSTSGAEAGESVAKAVGLSRPTLTRARKVVEAARADPERHGDLLERMNATGNVNHSWDRLRERNQGETKPSPVVITQPTQQAEPVESPAVETSFDSDAVLRKEVNGFDRKRFTQFSQRFAEAVKVAEEEFAKIAFGSEGFSALAASILNQSGALRQAVYVAKRKHRCPACDGAGCSACDKCGWTQDATK